MRCLQYVSAKATSQGLIEAHRRTDEPASVLGCAVGIAPHSNTGRFRPALLSAGRSRFDLTLIVRDFDPVVPLHQVIPNFRAMELTLAQIRR